MHRQHDRSRFFPQINIMEIGKKKEDLPSIFLWEAMEGNTKLWLGVWAQESNKQLYCYEVKRGMCWALTSKAPQRRTQDRRVRGHERHKARTLFTSCPFCRGVIFAKLFFVALRSKDTNVSKAWFYP